MQNFFSCIFRGSKIISHWYFVGLKFFLVDILRVQNFFSWVQNFFSWLFRGSEISSLGYFVGPRCFLVIFITNIHCTKTYIFFIQMFRKDRLHWNRIFLALSKKMIFLFLENMILFFRRKMKGHPYQKIHGNMILSIYSVNMVFLFPTTMILFFS